jgi:4-amino-4-deoxy-L-arabinose transferase-like glycosyltransferase
MWLNSLTLSIFADPLFAGRIISVVTGFLIMILLILLSTTLFNHQVAFVAAITYLCLPFSFFFDRMGLADNLLSFFGLASLSLSLRLAKNSGFMSSSLLGLVLGLAWITKSPAVFFIALSITNFFLFNLKNYQKVHLIFFPAVLSFFIYNLLRLSPEFHLLSSRNLDYVWSINDILSHPLDPLLPHLGAVATVYYNYLSLPLIIVALVGLFFYFRHNRSSRYFWLIFSWWLLPLLVNCAFAKVFTARYILYTLPPLIVLISLGISQFYRFRLFFPFLFIIFIPNLIWIKNISLSPFTAKIPPSESGYLRHWTSGWGIKEAAAYLKSRAKQANIIVGTEGFFGTLPNGLQIYTDGVKQLTVIGTGVDIHQIPEPLINAKNYGDEVYLLFNASRLKLTQTDFSKLKSTSFWGKPDGDRLLLLKL